MFKFSCSNSTDVSASRWPAFACSTPSNNFDGDCTYRYLGSATTAHVSYVLQATPMTNRLRGPTVMWRLLRRRRSTASGSSPR